MAGFSGFLPAVKSLVRLDSQCFYYKRMSSTVGFPGSLLKKNVCLDSQGFYWRKMFSMEELQRFLLEEKGLVRMGFQGFNKEGSAWCGWILRVSTTEGGSGIAGSQSF
jgi:hypothetical protein